MYDCTLHMFIKHLGIVHKTESDWVSWDKSEKIFHIQFKLVYPLSLSLELGTFNEVAPALNSLLELTNGGENYTIKAIFQWKLQGEIFIVTITKICLPYTMGIWVHKILRPKSQRYNFRSNFGPIPPSPLSVFGDLHVDISKNRCRYKFWLRYGCRFVDAV